MNKNHYNCCSQHHIRPCVLFFTCLLPALVSAEVPLETPPDSDKQSVHYAAQTVAVGGSASSETREIAVEYAEIGGENNVVIARNDEVSQPRLISTAFTPSDMEFRRATGENHFLEQEVDGTTETGLKIAIERNDTRQVPYSLLLVLVALIGLVPVSRRNQ